jgi:hypothetical protein
MYLDRSSFDIRKSKWSEAAGQYLFWKVKEKRILKIEFSSHIKKIFPYSMITHSFYLIMTSNFYLKFGTE